MVMLMSSREAWEELIVVLKKSRTPACFARAAHSSNLPS